MSQETVYRTFLSLPMHEIFQQEFERVIDPLKHKMTGIKWVLPSQAHITLHFFGKTTQEEIETIDQIVTPRAAKYAPLKFSLEDIGFFPNEERPRIIWIGITGDMVLLKALRREIEHALGHAGFMLEDRAFKPHVTIGRIKKETKAGFIDGHKPDVSVPKTESRSVDKIVLYQSILSQEGPRYDPLKTFHLSQKP